MCMNIFLDTGMPMPDRVVASGTIQTLEEQFSMCVCSSTASVIDEH